MPHWPHHRCAKLDGNYFLLSKALLEYESGGGNGNMIHQWQNKDLILFPGHVKRKDVPIITKHKRPAWRNGADMGYALIMHGDWMHCDAEALVQAQIQDEQSFPQSSIRTASHPHTVYQNSLAFQAAVPIAATRRPILDTDGGMISVGWWRNNKWSQNPTAIQT